MTTATNGTTNPAGAPGATGTAGATNAADPRANPVNGTVISITARMLLGRRRGLLLFLLPALLLALAVVLRWAAGVDDDVAVGFLGSFAIGTVLPLLALLAGTGVIGPEIDDGSIVYLLAKPIPRWHIVLSKLLVAVGSVLVLGALPILICAVILTGELGSLALGFGLGAAVSGVAYSAVFLLLGVVSRHAVVFGLAYAFLWESLIGGFVAGVKTLSIQQWALAVTRDAADVTVPGATVGLAVAVPALIITAAVATWYASRRLGSLNLSGEQ
jgi:ABC-2 type transport system permease protein